MFIVIYSDSILALVGEALLLFRKRKERKRGKERKEKEVKRKRNKKSHT